MPANPNFSPDNGGGTLTRDPVRRGGVDPAIRRSVTDPVTKPDRPRNRANRPCPLSQQRLDDARPKPQAHFHKSLDHDAADGSVDAGTWGQLIDGLKAVDSAGNVALLASIPTGPRNWVNPLAGWAVDAECSDGCGQHIPAPPALDSKEAAAEIVELYWMALLRDVPFHEWKGHADVLAAADELRGLPLYIDRDGDVNAAPTGGNGYVSHHLNEQSIFRGGEMHAGDPLRERAGPFVSQFLLRDIKYGTQAISQKQVHAEPGIDYMTDAAEWLAVQNGEARDPTQNLRGASDPTQRRHIITMRDLATYVHFDQLYQAYLNAALILLGEGYPLGEGNPYSRECDLYGIGIAGATPTGMTASGEKLGRNQIGFGTFGGPHILSLVTEVATRALKAVWRQKWTHLRLRPEAYAGLLHHGGPTASPGTFGVEGEAILAASIRNGAIGRVSAKNKGSASHNYLLPMAFPEGSPTHPAYGAGHATVAGACVTILKAFFDGSVKMKNPVQATADGGGLEPYGGGDAGALTVGLELDKLAANIAVGRDMAGVHWRSDYTQSMLLGQRVAVDVLYRQSRDYAEAYCFHFESFGGGTVDIEAAGVDYTPAGGSKTRILHGSNSGSTPVNDHGHADRILRKEDPEIAAALRAVV